MEDIVILASDRQLSHYFNGEISLEHSEPVKKFFFLKYKSTIITIIFASIVAEHTKMESLVDDMQEHLKEIENLNILSEQNKLFYIAQIQYLYCNFIWEYLTPNNDAIMIFLTYIENDPYIGMVGVRCDENEILSFSSLKFGELEGIFYNGTEETMGKFNEVHQKHIKTYFECVDVDESEKIFKFLICVVGFLDDLFGEIEEIDDNCGFGTEAYVVMSNRAARLKTKQDERIENAINFDLLRFPPFN